MLNDDLFLFQIYKVYATHADQYTKWICTGWYELIKAGKTHTKRRVVKFFIIFF